jgi:valyl-tRNA synthetase
MSVEMPPRFEPGTIEDKWYAFWQEHALFKAVRDIRKKPFSIMIPPPNVTGALHMGHALNNTLQDVVARFKRMQGFCVLWLPGTDHAGIATQAVVEKKLLSESGTSRSELGREAFVAEVWKWKDEYGNRILNQLRQLGASCDWSRTRFTLDEGLSRAVRESFVRLWNDGLIYRGNRMINWDCKLQTAISDDEIETSEVRSHLWYIKYPIKDQADKYIVVATTRPETMFGDTGVAVNPGDDRYTNLIGKSVVLPFVNREIPVVADETVNPEFGTGAVKVTPAHDHADYERGERHELPQVNVLNPDGTLNDNAGKFAGLDRIKARKQIADELDEMGLLERVEDYTHTVPHSDRSKTPIEPMLSDQWFVKMKPLAERALAAVTPDAEGKKEVRFVPERWEKVYRNWLENVRDWCISRQLWWGHRIPVWYDEDGNSVALLEDPADGAVHPESGKPLVRQDEDVLDTWASSWLWPFSTLGWPDKTADLDYFYPTHFLSTARDIIYLWVARMVMAGYRFMDEAPFNTVYVHATVLDAQGRRMSKSLNNGIDPLDMFKAWGVDAVRLTLPLLTSEGQDIKLSESKFEMGRNFCNKLWNASRFALSNLGDFEQQVRALTEADREPLNAGNVTELEDQFIEGRLTATIVDVTDALERYRFNEAAQALYHFVWDDFCDWYLEVIKPRLYDNKGGAQSRLAAQATLVRVLDRTSRMLHPYIPFITEEIWQNLRPLAAALRGDTPELSLAIATWPKASKDRLFEDAGERFAFVQATTKAFRNIRAEHALDPKARIEGILNAADPAVLTLMDEHARQTVCKLAGLSNLEVGAGAPKPRAAAIGAVTGGNEVYVNLEGLIDFQMELLRLEAAHAKLSEGVTKLKRKLENTSYVERAPKDVVQRDRDRLSELVEELQRTEKHVEEIRSLAAEG